MPSAFVSNWEIKSPRIYRERHAVLNLQTVAVDASAESTRVTTRDLAVNTALVALARGELMHTGQQEDHAVLARRGANPGGPLAPERELAHLSPDKMPTCPLRNAFSTPCVHEKRVWLRSSSWPGDRGILLPRPPERGDDGRAALTPGPLRRGAGPGCGAGRLASGVSPNAASRRGPGQARDARVWRLHAALGRAQRGADTEAPRPPLAEPDRATQRGPPARRPEVRGSPVARSASHLDPAGSAEKVSPGQTRGGGKREAGAVSSQTCRHVFLFSGWPPTCEPQGDKSRWRDSAPRRRRRASSPSACSRLSRPRSRLRGAREECPRKARREL
ncbi:PREDICTED: uncharacterized protein LOC106148513 [Chinchilla lanigera]|uniref:uncharacterized protein LOC106148513 n=1 Tax=Chinchilla lanigera TaxID=34839 RepID=UPI0006970146|nr:PREDICTED: uncharacterized protein LOC106148513 [Chinchilla lanigera]